MKTRIVFYAAVTAVFMGCLYFMWGVWHPEYLSYQEQYQLFLNTREYFAERLFTVGGLADYIGEWVVQHYYHPVVGAIFAAVLLGMFQALQGCICVRLCRSASWRPVAYALSLIPALMLVAALTDINMLMSYAAALVIALACALVISWIRIKRAGVYAAVWVMAFPLLYWVAGPVALLGIVLSVMLQSSLPRRWAFLFTAILYGVGVIFWIQRLWYVQYPESALYFGINYYRIPGLHPVWVFVVPVAAIGVSLLSMLKVTLAEHRLDWTLGSVVAACLLAAGFSFSFSLFDKDVTRALQYDYMVRNGRWQQIIKQAETEAPKDNFSLQAVNLALAKTGQLGDRMFQFNQNGIEGLLSSYKNDNTTCLVTAEAFYHLGMVNSALRYNFDLQEAIMNDRKSGRFMKRIAECLIINGQYAVAQKYIDMLSHSLYYKDWARNAQRLMQDEQALETHPLFGEKRANRMKQEMLYSYPEIDKLLGLLALESNGSNQMAWDYFNAALLLKGDLPTFTGMYHYAGELFGEMSMPRHWQEAMAMFWTFGHQNFDGIPYAISDETKGMISALARTMMQSQNNPAAWQQQFHGTYPVYFLSHQNQLIAPAEEVPHHE